MIDIEKSLKKITSNYSSEWNHDLHVLFRQISPYLWSLTRHNLHRFLKIQDMNPWLFRQRLLQLSQEPDFVRRLNKIEQDYNAYVNPQSTIVSQKYPVLTDTTIAYFSMEYGIQQLRIYSGGLGILSGDHLRGASDIGLKMVGLGLFYLHGYYQQMIESSGHMRVVYERSVPANKKISDYLPLEAVKKAGTNQELIIEVPICGRTVKAKVLRALIGRSELLLLDTNLKDNHIRDRHITRRLYASQKHHDEERRRRLEQEILLGIGGVKALYEAGYTPSVFHLNEGHVAFAALEILRKTMSEGSSFKDSLRHAASIIGFTTHTPVPEGNESFREELVREYLEPYLNSFLAPENRETIFNCARNRQDQFDMTKLSLMLSGIFRNGVSKLHGQVCRKMWGYAWGNDDQAGNNVQIGSITNAVHAPYWQKPSLRKKISEIGGIDHIHKLDDRDLWETHLYYKRSMIDAIRERFSFQFISQNMDPEPLIKHTNALLSEDAFMIGFARRFAQYKRVTLILDDEERLFAFLKKSYEKYHKPINILYAGKPHPDNYLGRDRIKQIYSISDRLKARCKSEGFQAQIIFIQGYDIELARYLEAGVDIWLNNPIRPLEASGTSGMKAGMNGVLNVSIPDGWVPEGITHGVNGWLFGEGTQESAEHDRDELFRLLEDEILPVYFEHNHEKWVKLMKNSIQSISKKFNTDRMLCEYVEKMYLPAVTNAQKEPALTAKDQPSP